MKLYISAILTVLMFFGCKKDSTKAIANYAFLGGEIINPSSKYVILEKDEQHIDTIKLDGRNRFLFKIDGLEEGLYTFKHGVESQFVLIEPKDSLLFRLNTLEFDESLVYTGNGSKKNNYFINEFLENEKEEQYILKLCQLSPKEFEKNVDSIKQKKLRHLEHFIDKYDASGLFKKIANANINYQYYSSKEVYPLMQYGKNKCEFLNELPETFYSYRKDINYNDTFFKNYHNYKMLLRYNLSNIALKTHSEHSKEKSFNWFSLCYNLDRLQIIDSMITDTSLKDQLLHKYAIKYISLSKNSKGNNHILKSFSDKVSDQNLKKDISDYVNALKEFEAYTQLPNFHVLDLENNTFDINSLAKSTTVINFWSIAYNRHFKDSYKKIVNLKQKYPEIKFISINIDDLSTHKAKQTLKKLNYSCDDQFLFKNPNECKKTLAIYPITKTIIIDKNNKIASHNTNIFSKGFEQQLLGLLNK